MIVIPASPVCRLLDFSRRQRSARFSKLLFLPACARSRCLKNKPRRLAEAEGGPGEAKMCNLRGIAVVLLLAALVTEAYSLDAAGTVVNLDEFAIVRNGTTIFDDSFDRNTTLNGGSGTVLPSGTTFSDGTPANYRVIGSISETTANNGQAQLNTANGLLIA